MKNGKKIIAVLPAYNAEKTLRLTLGDIPEGWVDEIILVDDASTDNTVKLSRKLGLYTIIHPYNRGYGGNQKTCYMTAINHGADVVIMVHPDHQYDPSLIPEMLEPIINGDYDAVFGSRMLDQGGALRGGMPRWKYVSNKFLTFLENIILKLKLTEYHSGFRAYSRRLLETVKYQENSDDFVFDTEIIVQLKIHHFRVKEIAIPTRYFKEASSVGLRRSIIYGLSIVMVMGQYLLHKMWVKRFVKFT